MDKIRLVYATTTLVGVSTVLIFMWQWWKKKCQEKPPSQWRKVGELNELWMFPVKSMGPIRIDVEVNCTVLGLKYGDWMYDRVFMVVDQEGKFITARRWPMLVKISINSHGYVLTLNAQEMPAISIDVATLLKKKPYKTAVWGQDVLAIDCGDDIAKWISQFILKADVGLRLAFYPFDRPTRKFPRKLLAMSDVHTGAYADATSYNMLNEASLMNLNERLEDPVSALNFRPNFVVKGPGAFEEDEWEWVKIGDVVFRNVMPCTRCLLTTVDPQTGQKNSKGEPLETLKSYRQINDPEIRRLIGTSPAFGIHLGLIGTEGKIRRGDDVYVGIS